MAVKNLLSDVKDYMINNKHIENIEIINRKKDIENKIDGYYLKISNKYPNRITVYEKTSKDMGYVFSNIVITVRKIYIFSLLELSLLPDNINFGTKEIENKMLMPKIELIFINELKEKLREKFKSKVE
jgi:hypothetical protein